MRFDIVVFISRVGSLQIRTPLNEVRRFRPVNMVLRHGELRTTAAFVTLNVFLFLTISPVYDFVCDLPYWERRRELRRKDREHSLSFAADAEGKLSDTQNETIA